MAVDIGAVTTRAAYFDVVEGRYRFIGMGQSSTTSNAPVRNAMLGVQLAIENLQTIIGKSLMDDEGRLKIPSLPDGSGVDVMVTTISLGPAIKTLIVGLLPDVSGKSIESLAQTTYARVVDSLKLNDPRKIDEQVDAIVRTGPELVLIAGGVDGGAANSLQKLLEVVGLGAYLLPENKRPVVLYAGNNQLAREVRAALDGIASEIHVSPNIRPSLEVEDLVPAQRELANIVVNIRRKQMPELMEVSTLSGGIVLPTSYAQGRMVRFLSSYFNSGKGVLSLDVGASALSLGASFGGELYLNVFPKLGLGEPLAALLKQTSLEEIMRWLPIDIPADVVRDYLYQKSIYPASIPVSREELAIEQAVVRQNLQIAARLMLQRLPAHYKERVGVLPAFERIIAGGSAITGAVTPGQKLLMLLDGLQPTGITNLVLDQYNLLAMLGASVETNSLLPVHVMDAGALSYLATVISPVTTASYGTPVLRAKLIRDDGSEYTIEVKMGNLQILPLESRQSGRLQLRPLHQVDVGLGPGQAGEVEVSGSALGVVIDARGRPMRLPADPGQRRTLIKKWYSTLGD